MRRGGAKVVEAAALAGFAAALLFSWVGRPTVRFPDTASYMHLDLLGRTGRLWTVPLVFAISATDGARTTVQLVIAGLCWGFCAVVLRRSIANPALGWLLFAAVLALAACHTVAQWHRVLLSESIALSLTVLAIAVWVKVLQVRSVGWWVAATAVMVLWTFTRQVNVPVSGAVVVALLLAARWTVPTRTVLVVAGVLAVATTWAAFAGTRSRTLHRVNASEIIANRVLLSRSETAWFAGRGMLVTEEERTLAGRVRHRRDVDVFLADRRLRSWVEHHFNSAYASYLATHPSALVVDPATHALVVVGARAQYAKSRAVLPNWLDRSLYDRRQLVILAFLGAVASLVRLAVVRRPLDPLETVATATVLAAGLWAWFVWMLSTNELRRLGTPPGVALRVALLAMTAASIDKLAARLHRIADLGPEAAASAPTA